MFVQPCVPSACPLRRGRIFLDVVAEFSPWAYTADASATNTADSRCLLGFLVKATLPMPVPSGRRSGCILAEFDCFVKQGSRDDWCTVCCVPREEMYHVEGRLESIECTPTLPADMYWYFTCLIPCMNAGHLYGERGVPAFIEDYYLSKFTTT